LNSSSSESAAAATAGIAVVASGVAKRYGPLTALVDFSLQVRRGEVLCLLGPNGSGKTTFMRMLAGFLWPDAGTLSVAGVDVIAEPLRARRLIGYVPESVPAYRHMRVGEFLTFMTRLRGVAAADVAATVERVARKLTLLDRMKTPVSALSRGYRQRVALAQALVHEPQLLILDEPTNGLDPRQIIDVRNLVRELAQHHTILMSSHILSEVEKTADRVAVLLQGRLRGVRDLADTPDLEAWYLSLS
jgi:ABC-2 type transport system ATP-binding protein